MCVARIGGALIRYDRPRQGAWAARRGDDRRVRPRTSADGQRRYPSIMELREVDMNAFGGKIFGAVIGGAIFFGVGIALAHAGAMVA